MFNFRFISDVRAIAFKSYTGSFDFNYIHKLFSESDSSLYLQRLEFITLYSLVSCSIVVVEGMIRDKHLFRFAFNCRMCHMFWVSLVVWVISFLILAVDWWSFPSVFVSTFMSIVSKSLITRR